LQDFQDFIDFVNEASPKPIQLLYNAKPSKDKPKYFLWQNVWIWYKFLHFLWQNYHWFSV